MTLHGYWTLVQRSGNTNKREAVLVVVHRAIVPALSVKRSWAPTGTYQASYQPKLPVVRAGIVRDRPCQWELGRSVGGAISALPPSQVMARTPGPGIHHSRTGLCSTEPLCCLLRSISLPWEVSGSAMQVRYTAQILSSLHHHRKQIKSISASNPGVSTGFKRFVAE